MKNEPREGRAAILLLWPFPSLPLHRRKPLYACPNADKMPVIKIGSARALNRHQAQKDDHGEAKRESLANKGVRIFVGGIRDDATVLDRLGARSFHKKIHA
jgi:hypothetical protein